MFKGPGSPIKSPSKDDGDDRVEEYEPQVDFQPVIPMPDLVEVKTGKLGVEEYQYEYIA